MRGSRIIGIILVILCLASMFIGASIIILRFKQVPSAQVPFPITPCIALLSIEGPITFSDSIVNLNKVQRLLKRLERIKNNPNIKAVVLWINSPGGSAAAVQAIYHAIKATGKPTVVSVGDIAASGGYHIALAADKIVAHEGSIVGSIGAVMILPKFEGLFKRIGIEVEVIKSGEYKDIGQPWRRLTPKEWELLQSITDSVHRQFIDVVKQSRKIPEEVLSTIADGRIFTATQAKELHLIDTIGTLDNAIQLAKVLAKIKGKVRIIKEFDVLDILGKVEERLKLYPRVPAVYYLYWPGL